MGLRDRFFTPTTANAILSWRILIGVAAAAALGLAGLPLAAAIGVGAGVYAGTVVAAMPKAPSRPSIDPFTLGEPWRRLMQQAQSAGRKLRSTVEGADDGPLKQALVDVADQLEQGLVEAWEIAKRGDEIDDAVRRLDPTALRSKLATLRARADAEPTPETTAAIESTERQLAAADRLKQQSEQTAGSLRLTQTRLDELVARASEVRLGSVDTEAYRREVDELVIKLEAMHAAVEELRST